MNPLYTSAFGAMVWAAAATAGPLHDASKNGDVEGTKRLLDQGLDVAEPDSAVCRPCSWHPSLDTPASSPCCWSAASISKFATKAG